MQNRAKGEHLCNSGPKSIELDQVIENRAAQKTSKESFYGMWHIQG